jgi:ABC-type polysaccharide/polyol phosphate export permease
MMLCYRVLSAIYGDLQQFLKMVLTLMFILKPVPLPAFQGSFTIEGE